VIKKNTFSIAFILFLGFTAGISYLQKDLSHGVILTIAFVYYGVKFLVFKKI
jgi:hypothetical protein